jgi:hypothetical protein
MNCVYYEKKPEVFSHDNWVAPEHWVVARNMIRIKGVLQIEKHPIFAHSRQAPPASLVKPVKKQYMLVTSINVT